MIPSRAAFFALFGALFATLLAGAAAAADEAQIVAVRAPEAPVEVPASGGAAEVELAVAIAPKYHLYGENESGYIPLKIAAKTGAKFTATAKLPPAHVKELFGEKIPVYEGTIPAKVAIAPAPGAELAPGAREGVPLEVSFQACTDEFCKDPASIVVTVPVTVGAAASGSETAATSATSASTSTSAAATEGGDGESGLLRILGAFLAGLGVTLTPCVYPLIPVTVTYFQQQAQGSRAKAIPLAVAYGAGIVLMYAALGVGAARIGKDLGAVLGNDIVGWGFAALFVVFALSMFGLFELQLPSSIATKLQSGERAGAIGALLLGLTLGLVAAPCTGPVAGGLMLFVAQSGDILFGLEAFGAFGLGIALPFMALGTFSGALSSMPRAGAWMNSVKVVFGFILLAFAIYFVDIVLGDERVAFALFGLLLGAGGALAALGARAAFGRKKAIGALVRVALALTLVPAGLWLLAGPYVLSADAAVPPPQRVFEPKIAWRHEHDAALAEAKRAGKPVFIDFTARWCLPCRELDYTTFRDDEVVRETRRFVAVKLDFTKPDSEPAKLKMELYKAPYAPFIAFYDSKGNYLPEKSFKGKPTTAEFLARLREIR